ncbi:4a-hydroxytetrahydrobiopterin dehydratase [Leptolyngbya sp. PCC 6406]|uniref:4a-hydroxytetrahydrobiopterin dehydratase n=1 Tax=Leptolyngbya sp. PCC 6406 TaxID=1173264 RepID=UPI0002AC6990|nr:4a-hydroxytetrahydrobiopterin dehydratase [Leptolyngbya sp. PCC 6406]
MATLLTHDTIQSKLSPLKGWTLKGKAIQTVKTFDGFPSAIAFVNKLVDPAEAAGHHPDIAISYNQVTITVTSHDAGGLTEKDFALAAEINQIA